MKKSSLIFALAALTCSSGALAAGCGTAPNDSICLGTVTAPPEQKGNIEAAVKAAIDALFSPDLEKDYKAYTATHIVDGPQQEAWKSVEIDTLLEKVRAAIGGMTVTTYGGVGGWFKKTFSGDTMTDGVQPIQINRWILPQPVPALAKSIAHEAAHKVGLKHPSANPGVAACEPPNVIGSLVEKQIVGAGWKPGTNDCPTIGR